MAKERIELIQDWLPLVIIVMAIVMSSIYLLLLAGALTVTFADSRDVPSVRVGIKGTGWHIYQQPSIMRSAELLIPKDSEEEFDWIPLNDDKLYLFKDEL